MQIETYLYDANGNDKQIELNSQIWKNLNHQQLLWVNVLQRDVQTIKHVAATLELRNVAIKTILDTYERPKLNKFETFYQFFIVSVETDKDGQLKQIPIDFLVGRNFVVTIHDGRIEYFLEFLDRERGETSIGELDAESFIATLLDLHIVTYFRALEGIERTVDRLDERILRRDLKDEDFIKEMVELRRKVSKLRRWFEPHRDVFYALSRPDFLPIAQSDSSASFQMLNGHFENAVQAIESSRDTVLSLFDLYTTKSAHNMNNLMKRLTFVTLMVGGLGAIAGVWGMNFEVEYFKAAETGFWLTILGMGIFVLGTIALAKLMRWF